MANPKLDPRVKGVVSRSDRFVQIGLRWLSVLAISLVAVKVGNALDITAAGRRLPASWWVWVVFLVAVAALSGGLAVTQSLRVQNSAERSLRNLAHDASFALGPIRVQGHAGQLLDLASTGAMRAARYRGGFLSASVASLSAPLIVLAVIGFSAGWGVAGLMTVVVVVGPLLIGAFQGMNKDVGDRFRDSQSHLREKFLEGVNALESLSYAGAGNSYAKSLAGTNEEHRKKIMRLLASNQLLILIMDLVFSLGALILATILAVRGIGNGTLTTGQALSVILLTIILVAPVDLIGQFFYVGIGGRAAQRQFSVLLSEVEAAKDYSDAAMPHPGEGPEPPAPPAILLDHVTAGWPGSEPVLRDVSIRVDYGEHVALVGPSGSGKSTLSAVVQGLIHPDTGRVLTNAAPPSEAVDSIAVVEQRSYLFNASIAENLRLAKPHASDAELWSALEKANLAADIRAIGSGLETQVGNRGSRLSGGQAQRLAVARALLKDAPILVLDEPTSQVDLRGEALILEAIGRASKGRTVLTIAHRSAAVREADRVLVVPDGIVAVANEGEGDGDGF
ncbi:ATP-binding cassette domain-containing protein [Actinomycetaceae bacterium MB13-C1-2]|nr:ATP-binding cassette domain-containing protein [Actinomycetaceae bacterium MB13-C1-2]